MPTLSTTVSVAIALPTADGLNEIPMAHDPPALSEELHVLLPMTNSDAFVPVMLMEVIGRAALPPFFKVNVCDVVVDPTFTLPKEVLAGERFACGMEGGIPAPSSAAVCMPALSMTESVADALPVAVGENVTSISQL